MEHGARQTFQLQRLEISADTWSATVPATAFVVAGQSREQF